MKSEKIGILTLPPGKNFGGILQAYALCESINNLGCSAVVLMPKCSSVKDVLRKVADYYSPTSCFVRQKIQTLYVDFNNLYADIVGHGIDTVVVGSDQVWRPGFMSVNLSFCVDFDFSRVKVLSYAASFGFDSWNYNAEETEKAKKSVQLFSGISVREDSAVSLCEKYLHAKAVHVLDPTMLMEKTWYSKMCKLSNDKYIFCYLLGYEDNRNADFVNFVHKRFGLEVRRIYLTKNKLLKRFKFNDTIQNWLSLICNSQLVITDSFHGTVFSIIFNRPFFVLQNNKGGNSRLYSLLKIFGLEERMIQSSHDIIDKPIDWDKVNNVLEQWKEHSLNFLSSVLYDKDC